MAILLIEIAIITAMALVFDAVALEKAGWLYAMIGMMFSIFELGRLVVVSAGAAISTAVITTIGFSGGVFTPYTVDATPFIIALALMSIYSSLVMIDLVWPGRPTAQGAYH